MDEKPISLDLPNNIECIVDTTDAAIKGQTAASSYKPATLDNRIKITNLPTVSLIRIFTVNGTLIRTIKKSDNLTSVDWDLKNDSGIPVASGLYIIHINADGVGEKILKWFGVLRPIDLDTF
jgi:flagellar hook assembly protein FlgD